MKQRTLQIIDIIPVAIEGKRYPIPNNISSLSPEPVPTVSLQVDRISDEHWQVLLEVEIAVGVDPPIAHLQSSVVGVFALNEAPTDEDSFRNMYQNTVLNILIPFARESILEICSRLRLSPIVLPHINEDSPEPTETVTETIDFPVPPPRVRKKGS